MPENSRSSLSWSFSDSVNGTPNELGSSKCVYRSQECSRVNNPNHILLLFLNFKEGEIRKNFTVQKFYFIQTTSFILVSRIILHQIIIFLCHFFRQLQILSLAFSAIFGGFQVLIVILGRKSHSFDRMIVQIQAELNSLMKSQLWLTSTVNVTDFFALHPSIFVVQHGLNDTISNSLKNIIFWRSTTMRRTYVTYYLNASITQRSSEKHFTKVVLSALKNIFRVSCKS